jgi:hypothetical protein
MKIHNGMTGVLGRFLVAAGAGLGARDLTF